MTIERAISGTVYTRLVTTTSILAKLTVCAVLLAGVASAHAANDDETNRSGVARRSGVHAAQNHAGAKPRPIRRAVHSNLSKLEREWKRQQSVGERAMLRRLVACRELGQCEGLTLHPTRGAALIGVSPDKPVAVAAAPLATRQSLSAARGVYAAAKGKKPMVSARVRSKQSMPARIRSAAVGSVATDPDTMNPQVRGDDQHRGWVFGGFPSANP